MLKLVFSEAVGLVDKPGPRAGTDCSPETRSLFRPMRLDDVLIADNLTPTIILLLLHGFTFLIP